MKRLWVMIALVAAAALSPHLATAATPDNAHLGAPAVIWSHAGLRHYLQTTPPAQSPLSLLPIGARRRFLGTLVWGRQGLGGFGTSDLQQYLTDAQIRRVLGLFDAESYATNLHGRAEPLSAAKREAPETDLERKFDTVYFARADSIHDKSRTSASTLYDTLLAPYQQPSTLARLDDSDVGLLFRAAGDAASTAHGPHEFDDLRLDLTVLHHRGLATPAMITSVHDSLVAARRFDQANVLATEYPVAGIKPLPPLRQAPGMHEGNPTVLLMQPDGKSMLHRSVEMRTPLRIVVVAGCHFSEDAVRAIRADPQLDRLFHEHAIWLAGENESLTDVLAWNRDYPDQPMNVAWRDSEWTMLDSWLIPTYYVFRGGALVGRWSGWNGVHDLQAHLRKLGLLP